MKTEHEISDTDLAYLTYLVDSLQDEVKTSSLELRKYPLEVVYKVAINFAHHCSEQTKQNHYPLSVLEDYTTLDEY